MRRVRLTLLLVLLISGMVAARIVTPQTNSAKELRGLWEAKKRFGPRSSRDLFVLIWI
jgi:hypothetical protein